MMDSPSLLPSVESWIWPIGLAEFREHYWFQRPFVQDRGPSAIGAYRNIGPSDASDVDWLYSLGGHPQVPIHRDGRLMSVASVSLKEAAKFYHAGQTVYVMDPEPLIPSAQSLARTFDLPLSHIECNLYLSKAGCHTTPHFDATETFVIQLRGTKIWHLAENDSAPLPLNHWHLQRPVPSSIRNYVPGEWPSEMPADTRTVVATPGTVMYVPRGTWHATNTQEDSISAHMHYRVVLWADLAQTAIYKELCRHREWRRPAVGLGRDSEQRRRAGAELMPLLAKLAEDIAGLGVSDLVGPAIESKPSEDDTTKYKRVALGSGGVEFNAADGVKVMRFTVAGPLHELVNEFEVPESFVGACLWICSRSLADRFDIDDIARLGPSRIEARQFLPALADAGVIERVES